MSIWISLNPLSKETKDRLAQDLTVVQLDESYEKMKKRGKIDPGHIPKPDSKIPCYHIDPDRNLWVPYHYARMKFGLKPKLQSYPLMDQALENKIDLREAQVEVVEHCFNDLIAHGCTTVGLPPGFGKTYIGAFLSHCLKLKVLIVVPIASVIKAWENTFKTALPGVSVWCVDEFGRIPKGWESSMTPPDVTICLDPRLAKLPKHWKNKFGTMIIDETHLIPTRDRIENLLSIRPAYVIMETATMEREDGLHKICHLIGGNHGIFRQAKDPYKFCIVQMPFVQAEESFTARGVNYGALCESLSNDKVYNTVILGIVKKNPESKFMILTRRAEHGNLLKDLFNSNGIPADTFLRAKKSYVNSRVLIGTFQKIGTGFDEATFSEHFEGPKSDSLIICHSVAKNRNFEQFRGRVMRTQDPTVYWLNVKNGVIRAHLTPLKKHVKETNGTIIEKDGYDYL